MQVTPPSERRSRWKSVAFRISAIALPVVVVLLLEAVLRLAGVAEERRRPFQPLEGRPSHVALDPDFGGMFFRGFRPGVAFDPFAAEKPAGGLRVVAMGGSTTAGFPYHWYYGFPALLEDRLAAALPGRSVEVVNLGMTATNSYTIRALADAVVSVEPDAVVIYSGHNEYYGAYGPGGMQGVAGTPGWMKRLAIGASRWAVVAGPASLLDGNALPAGERRTIMARVVRDASIARGGAVYDAGIAQFEANLRASLRRFEQAGIPVFLATPASNLSDQPPLGDEPEALAAFERGRSLLAAGDTVAARAAFLEAKELDGIRFRAPEAMNAVVTNLGAAFDNVTVVDAQERLRRDAPGGLEGASLFTDHLHPNADGYARIADAFFEAMRDAHPALRDAFAAPAAVNLLDPVEVAYSDLQLTILKSGYPFSKDRTPTEAEEFARAVAVDMARSDDYAEQLAARTLMEGEPMAAVLHAAARLARAAGDTLSALRHYRALMHWQPFNERLTELAVGFAIRSPAYDDETARLARIGAGHTYNLFSLNALAAMALRGNDLERAERLLALVEQRDPSSEEMLYNRARLLVMRGDTARARGYFERFQAARGE